MNLIKKTLIAIDSRDKYQTMKLITNNSWFPYPIPKLFKIKFNWPFIVVPASISIAKKAKVRIVGHANKLISKLHFFIVLNGWVCSTYLMG